MKYIRQYRIHLGIILGLGFVNYFVKLSTQFHWPVIPSLIAAILIYYVGFALFSRLLE